MSLTANKEAFCQIFVETGDECKAYRRSSKVARNLSESEVDESAKNTLIDPDIQKRIIDLYMISKETTSSIKTIKEWKSIWELRLWFMAVNTALIIPLISGLSAFV